MPYVVTVAEVVEALADEFGVYEDPRCESTKYGGVVHYPQDQLDYNDCNCRIYWVPRTIRRIRDALKNEKRLAETMPSDPSTD